MSQILLRTCQIVAASILLFAAFGKFVGNEGNVALFTQLGMEPFGRYLVGAVEALAGLLLLHSLTRALGALLALGIMFGALIAHFTRIGLTPGDDGGLHLVLLATVLLTAGYVLIRERHRLPLFGDTL